MRPGARLRWVLLRTSWLLVGAALGLAAVLLCSGLAQVLRPGAARGWVLVVALSLAVVLGIGLLPGVRELEVTAARALLGVRTDLVVPERPRAGHRWRTTVLVAFHLAAGLLAAVLLVGALPGVLVLTTASVSGRAEVLAGVRLAPVAPALAVPLALAAALGCLVGTWALGRLGPAVAGRLLGPTAHDRLEVALARLAAESEHTRLARELHDGIGHALTIIGVQAAGGRQALTRDPAGAGGALSTIESTARQALTDLDDMLGLLRDRTSARTAEPDLARLPALIEAHRSAGMTLVVESAPVQDLPRLVSTTAYRIVAEALTNAQRYAGSGPVRLRLQLQQGPGLLSIEASSPLSQLPRPGAGSGQGLRGIAERAALFGGTMAAGERRHDWVLRVEIPTGAARD